MRKPRTERRRKKVASLESHLGTPDESPQQQMRFSVDISALPPLFADEAAEKAKDLQQNTHKHIMINAAAKLILSVLL